MKQYQKFLGYILAAVLVILPFQYLWIRPYELIASSELTVFLITNWYEILLILGLPLMVWFFVTKKDVLWFDWLFFSLVILALSSSIWSPTSFSTDIIGLRYGVGFILFYFLGRSLNLAWPHPEKLLQKVFITVIGLAILQGVSWTISKDINFSLFSVRDLAGTFPRLYGTLIGPNQLATYTACIGLWLYSRKALNGWLLAAVVVVVVGTFSRSATLGLLVGLIVIAWQQRAKIRWVTVGAVTTITVLAAVTIFALNREVIEEALVGSRHTTERVGAFEDSISRFSKASLPTKLFGHGVTTAGPSTFVTDQVFVPENWFLQVIHELGLVGLGVFLTAMIGVLRFLSRNGSHEFLPVFAALGVNSLFLHPLADNPTTGITIFVLLALAVTQAQQKRMLEL